MTITSLVGSFTTTGASAGKSFCGDFNITVWGSFTGSIRPERSFDGGLTWHPFTYSEGTAISWTAPFSGTFDEPENSVQWRLYATTLSGTANYRLSQ